MLFLAYRAPEYFDVSKNSAVDFKVNFNFNEFYAAHRAHQGAGFQNGFVFCFVVVHCYRRNKTFTMLICVARQGELLSVIFFSLHFVTKSV